MDARSYLEGIVVGHLAAGQEGKVDDAGLFRQIGRRERMAEDRLDGPLVLRILNRSRRFPLQGIRKGDHAAVRPEPPVATLPGQ